MWRPLNCKAICVQLCNTHTVFTNAFSVKYWVMELKSCKRRKRNGKIKGNCNTICAKRSAKCIQIFLNHGTDGYSQDNSVLDEVCILDKKVLTILVLRSSSSRNVSSVHQSISDMLSEIFKRSLSEQRFKKWLLVIIIIIIIIAKRVKLSPFHFLLLMSLNES